ncbi:tetratricopeptide repeat protein [Cyclobacterium plantarum]|uniref:tetratricopeptide repeat protein n=1 Tax=Cyclobacterium plantarum TaxID=2716263 RepID=UPI003F717307
MHQQLWRKTILTIVLFVVLLSGIGILILDLGAFKTVPLSIATGLETITVPLGDFFTGTGFIRLNTQNFLLFERFVAGEVEQYPILTQWLGILTWLLLLVYVWLITLVRRNAFLLGAGLLVFMLTISGVNSLNIGGVGTNYGLVICLVFLLLPIALIHLFFENLSLVKRALIVFGSGLGCLVLLIFLANAPYPTLLFSENISLMAMSMAAGYLIYTGQSLISGIYLLLARMNRGVGIKIAWHFAVLGTAYLMLLGLMLLDITGSINGWPLPPFELLLLIVGLVGYFDVHHKINNHPQPFAFAWVGKLFYLTGLAMCLLLIFKGKVTLNTPMLDFLQHIFIYSQLGFGLLFFLYIWVNFSGILNSGTAVERIVYKPPFFPYFHMRLGGFLSLLIFLVYADGIVAIQFSTSSTQFSADYYLASKRPVEATVLYENAFERYRKNEKALFASAQLYLDQNQPTLAQNTLLRSFEENPQVLDIILLSELLEKRKRVNESIYYLEEGLTYYPSNPYLSNNLALIYHQMNRPDDALRVLANMKGEESTQGLNQLGVKIFHGKEVEENDFENAALKDKINLLAYANVIGEAAGFDLPVDSIRQGGNLVNQAMLRNQFTALKEDNVPAEYFEIIDTLLQKQAPSLNQEESIRESGLVLAYKSGRVNDLLRRLNGMAFRFNKNAGYYHAFAGWVLSREGDFKKAAIEWKQAALKGFSQFTSAHLPYLYFGGMQEEALFVSGTQGVDFPVWMRFDSERQLIQNDTVKFYQALASLPEMLGRELLPALEGLETSAHRAFLAREMLLKKGHWFSHERLDSLLELTLDQEVFKEEASFLTDYVNQMKGADSVKDNPDFSAAQNAYLTPLVLAGLATLSDDEERYALLQEASQFNRDPLLWIELVRYCRIIGLDQYASSNLALMAEWIGPEDLTELQLEYF